MKRLDPYETMFAAMDIDPRKDTFIETLDKLEASGHSTFRVIPKPGCVVCVIFNQDAAKAVNDALEAWFDGRESGNESS